jgi:hypothetical protein
MLVAVIPIAWLMASLLGAGQDEPAVLHAAREITSPVTIAPTGEAFKPENRQAIEGEVNAERLDVFDQPEDQAFITGRLQRGDRVHVRPDRIPRTGWLAIERLPTSICWIEESSLEPQDGESPESMDRELDTTRHDRSHAAHAWVNRSRAVIRSGHPGALIPGPPQGALSKGTMVQLVDRPALLYGQGSTKSRWLAIVPPADKVFYIHANGVRWLSTASTPPIEPAAEVRASYEEARASTQEESPSRGTPKNNSSSWPAEISAELERIDATYKAIIASQPIHQWRFETVRADYQSLLKRAGDRLDLEDELRTRLARVTQHEQAARAARTIDMILTKSHRRDSEVAAVRRDLARLEQTRTRAFDAVGFIQPSARKVDGHKVFALIGAKGSTIAYLDIPVGLDPEPFLARRVGVRGQAHFSEDLGTRLITVRDMENIEARK